MLHRLVIGVGMQVGEDRVSKGRVGVVEHEIGREKHVCGELIAL